MKLVKFSFFLSSSFFFSFLRHEHAGIFLFNFFSEKKPLSVSVKRRIQCETVSVPLCYKEAPNVFISLLEMAVDICMIKWTLNQYNQYKYE